MIKSKQTFGDWLRAKRLEKGLSGPELERRSGVSRQYISNLERNLRSAYTNELIQPSVEKVEALAKGLGVSSTEARLAAGWAADDISTDLKSKIANEEIAFLASEYQELKELTPEEERAEIRAVLQMVRTEFQRRLQIAKSKGKKK